MKLKNNALLYFLFVVILLCVFSTVVFCSKNLSKYRSTRNYTIYDSQTFYNVSSTIKFSSPNEYFKDGPYRLAYLAYPKYLILVHNIYTFLGVKNVSYQLMVFSNFILLIVISVLYYQIFKPARPIELLLIVPLLFEPSILGFSLTLEREVFGSLFLAFIALTFAYEKGKKKWIILFILLIIGFNIRREILLVTIISIIIFYFLNYYRSISDQKNKLFFIKIVLLLVSIFSIFFYLYFTKEIDEKLNGLIATASTSGFGSIILSFPLVFRFLSYFVLFFFAPIPATSLLNYEFLFPYEWFLLFSGISYLVLWIIVLKNYAYINLKERYLLIVLLVSHFVFGSVLFNIRHRTDIIVLLVCLVLIVIKNKLNKGFSIKYIINENFIILFIVLGIQLMLHSVYFFLKLV
jgi:hypothetical protein